MLADQFYGATIETSFNILHPIDTKEGYNKPEVHRILDELSDGIDFQEFSDELKSHYGQRFL